MSHPMVTKAMRGAAELVDEAERMLQQAMAARGRHAPISFSDTVYYLPLILGIDGKAVEKVGDLQPVVQQAREMLRPARSDSGGTSEPAIAPGAELAVLRAAETLEALHWVEATTPPSDGTTTRETRLKSPMTDLQVRTWGVQFADGRIPGVALILGPARNNPVALKLVEALRRYNVLCLLSGAVDGRSLSQQLQEEGIESGGRSGIVLLGDQPASAVHALGFLARCAMKLGGHKPGAWREMLNYCKRRIPGFVLALGELDDPTYALAVAAGEFGWPLIMDTVGAVEDAEQVFRMPLESMDGVDEVEKAGHLAEKCMALRGIKGKLFSLSLPVAYGPAFEDEVICDADLHARFGGQGCRAFELLQREDSDQVADGRIEVIGPALPGQEQRPRMDLGIVVKVAGARLQTDFEPYLERQIHAFLNYAAGVQHAGQQDGMTIRISRAAAAMGFGLESLGKILQARFHEEFGAAIEKVEIILITEANCHAEWLAKARAVYDVRKKRAASLTDDQVDVFYVCTRCRSFAPHNVSIISPERVSPCGQCNWLDARAAFEMNPTGLRRPIKLGQPIDIQRGIWEGTNRYAKTASHGRMSEVALYSIMQSPMGACGDFECIVMLIPEANGVMVVSHEDTTLATPAGITIETFASLTAGEQIPGVLGIGRGYLLSPKFIAPEGGFRRVVWMSSRLKAAMSEELKAVCAREGDPALMERIADERNATSVEDLVGWLKQHKHPALEMEPMF